MESQNNSNKKVCLYCQANIKPNEDFISCPLCNSPHHIDCWYENIGCSSYGCGYKIPQDELKKENILSVKDLVSNIEILYKKREFTQALVECNRLLSVEPENNLAKNYYSKIVNAVNTKISLLEKADESFDKKDFKSAEIYYNNSLPFLNELEYPVVTAKLQVIRDAIPKLVRKRKIRNIFISILIILIFCTAVFSAYYYVAMQPDRELYEISKNDNSNDISIIEDQIYKYERFLKKYDNSSGYDVANDKVTELCSKLILKLYKDDWRTALKFLKKINENSKPKTYNDLSKLIYSQVEIEFSKTLSLAKNYNKQQKFPESKKEIEKALSLLTYFPESEINNERPVLNSNLNLLNRKITSQSKYKDIEKEISEKTQELKKLEQNVKDDNLNVSPIQGEKAQTFSYEKESLIQRLSYLTEQKSKIDSLFKLTL